MSATPNIGDIMLLSSLAWKIGTAFASGRASAPSEFKEVEDELESLTASLTMLADTLDADDNILAAADDETKEGLTKILDCCQETLENLDSFVNNYQELQAGPGTKAANQRTWKTSFVRNYQKVYWTREGGNIQGLRNMLQMHDDSVNLTVKALESKSPNQLQSTIGQISAKIDGIHDQIMGSIDDKIAEMHSLMMSMTTPSESPRLTYSRQSGRESLTSTLIADAEASSNTPRTTPKRYVHGSPMETGVDGNDDEEGNSGRLRKGHHSPWAGHSRSGSDTFTDSEISPISTTSSPKIPNSRTRSWSGRFSARSFKTLRSTRESDAGNESSLVPEDVLSQSPHLTAARRISSRLGHPSALPPVLLPEASLGSDSPPSPIAKDTDYQPRKPQASASSSAQTRGGLNIITSQRDRSTTDPSTGSSLTPSSTLAMYSTDTSTAPSIGPPMSPVFKYSTDILATPQDDVRSLASTVIYREADVSTWETSSPEQDQDFQTSIFGDGAILSQSTGSSVEYTQPDEEKQNDWKIVEATGKCTITVVTKRFRISPDKIRYISSVWALSDNRKVRLQQRLLDDEEVIPYTVWGNKTKVVLRVPTELKYHGFTTLDKPMKIAKTAWVNYIFEDEQGANEFQNALMGKRLRYSLSTRRTLRTHENIVQNTFAFQEQLCGLENLRLWTDDEGDGSVLAMIQYSASFRDGYLAFRLGGPYTAVQVRDDGERWVRIKGLNVSFESAVDKKAFHRTKPSETPFKNKKDKSDKKITGVRIEFSSLDEKQVFIDQFRTAKSGKFFR